MDGSNLGGFLSGSSGSLFDMQNPMHRHPQSSMGQSSMTHQPNQLLSINMMSGLENEPSLGFVEGKGVSSKGLSMDIGKGKGISLGHTCSNQTNSEDEETGCGEDASGENCKRGSPWQRMKWTDNVVRLLIAVVASVGDDYMHEGMNDTKKKSGMLQKKGKWKMVSNIMISKGCCVSPQQCEDKFNDLNKRYKKLNDILGRGTSCQVVENPSLMDSMPHLTTKAKDEVKKILGSKHLFYREMCAYHNGQKIPGCHDIDFQAHLSTLAPRPCDNDGFEEHDVDSDDDDDSHDNNDKNVEENSERMEEHHSRNSLNEGNFNFQSLSGQKNGNQLELDGAMFLDLAKSPAEQRELVQQRALQLEKERLRLDSEAYNLEKERFKWILYRNKKEEEIQKTWLEHEQMKLENQEMILSLKQKALEFDMQRPEMLTGPSDELQEKNGNE